MFTFSCTKFLNFMNTGAELGQYFVLTHTERPKSKSQLRMRSPLTLLSGQFRHQLKTFLLRQASGPALRRPSDMSATDSRP